MNAASPGPSDTLFIYSHFISRLEQVPDASGARYMAILVSPCQVVKITTVMAVIPPQSAELSVRLRHTPWHKLGCPRTHELICLSILLYA
jgi:hypothetical protein